MKLILATLALAALAAGIPAQDAPPAATKAKVLVAQVNCPIGGKAIDKEHFVDYEGHRIYFCCENCPKKFAEFPDKYIYAMYQAGEQPENLQKTCVVSGMDLENRDHFVQVLNKRVYTCCDKCKAKVAKDPATYLDKLEGRKAQAVCPVMGKAVDKTVFSVVQGQKVYYCCPGCSDKMAAEPDKYFGVLAKQGIVTEAADNLCPVMEEPIETADYFVTYKGRRFQFCCEKCIRVFAKDPQKWVVEI